jgi:glycosyltransferase involved in cell wall biosynthesis
LALFRNQSQVEAELWIIGAGKPPYLTDLRALATELNVSSYVRFLGWLPAADKQRCMSRAYALLMTSVREGWGLVVSEANACGTPAVAYNVSGLSDAVRHEVTGLLVDPTPSSLATGMLRLWNDSAGYQRMSDEAKKWSATLSFENSATVIRDAMSRSLASQQSTVDSAAGAGIA